jgi:hypothetical protein
VISAGTDTRFRLFAGRMRGGAPGPFMSYFRCKLGNAWRGAATLVAVGLAGCANSCFVFVSSNGSSGVFVKVGDPPPVCSLDPAKGAIRAAVLKLPVCEACSSAAKIEHVFLTLRGIQLGPSTVDTNSSEWLEIAPHLAAEPRQIDLMGNSAPEILVDHGMVTAESYREVRLQFVLDFPSKPEMLPIHNACGQARWNCVVMADGRAEPLRLPRDVPELLIPLSSGDEAVVVLPDSNTDLQISLEPHRVLAFSGAQGLQPQNVLAGRAHVVREWHLASPAMD